MRQIRCTREASPAGRRASGDAPRRSHGGVNPGRPDQGRRDRRSDRPAVVHRARERERGANGDRRPQRRGRPARAAARPRARGQRNRRRGGRRQGGPARRARPGRRRLRRHLQLDETGDQGPGRRRGRDALHLPRAVRGPGGRPVDLLHGAGAGAAGRPADPLADAGDGREDVLSPVGRLRLAARAERARQGGRRGQRRLDRGRGVLPARPHRLPRDRRANHGERCRRGVQHDRPAGADAVLRRVCTSPASRNAEDSSSARTSTRTS